MPCLTEFFQGKKLQHQKQYINSRHSVIILEDLLVKEIFLKFILCNFSQFLAGMSPQPSEIGEARYV